MTVDDTRCRAIRRPLRRFAPPEGGALRLRTAVTAEVEPLLRAELRAALTRLRPELEARLSTVQAHADRDFIVDILTRIEALHGHDAARAELLLSQLIDVLREALPRVRDGRTTLGREARLVGACIAIARVRLDDRLGGFPADEFDELRIRLVDLYREKAQLSIGTATMSRRTIALEIPAGMNEPATATGA